MFINISNHPAANWSAAQLAAASHYGEVVDYPFPVVPASSDEGDVRRIAESVIRDVSVRKEDVLLIQGEFTLAFQLVVMAKALGMRAVAACSDRVTEERVNDDGTSTKISRFEFVRFRDY